jgi:hypothetical protein
VTRTLALGLGVLVLSVAGAASVGSAESMVVHDATASDIAPLPSIRSGSAAAAWCGTASQTDRAPNLIAGNPIHWVYMIPSDGPDDLATLGSIMQADAEQIDAWWRREDPVRTPRNDLTTFSCGTQLDVTTVRMTQTGAQLAPLQGRFAAVAETLEDNGFRSPFTKYVVYYDGPTTNANICGQGGSEGSGFGVAAVYIRACVGVSTAAVAAHEFLHTAGAVSSRAPGDCDGERSGHVCDDERDLMYWRVGGVPLTEKLLDVGRNDYYGHAGSWTDTQDSAWLVRLDAQAPLAVTVTGPGSVSSDVPGLLCAASCSSTWNSGQRLALTATPRSGAKLVRWRGACTGAAGCALSVGPGASVSAQFAPAAFPLAVAVTGRGTVRSARAGITCRPRCAASFPSFTPLRLTATPAPGWKLRSWTGACRGAQRTCTVPMTAASTARARFVRQ